jgi:hypothetical protein
MHLLEDEDHPRLIIDAFPTWSAVMGRFFAGRGERGGCEKEDGADHDG